MKTKSNSAMTLLVICLVVTVAPQIGGFIPNKDFSFLMSLLGVFGLIISFFFTLVVIYNNGGEEITEDDDE